mgnify:CR=1 FL=1
MQKIDTIKKCNKCGKELPGKYDACLIDGTRIQIDWGYFSKKDGQRHTFCLCEECYDKITSGFLIPVKVEEKTELI